MAAQTDLQIYRALRKLFRTIDENVDDLALHCKTFEQARQLVEEWTQAQKNYIDARNRIFDSNDKKVKALYEELGTAQDAVEKSLRNLKKIERVLDQIGDAVRTGTTLLALGVI